MTEHVLEQLRQFERELAADPALCGRILAELPAVPTAPERVIRTSSENVDRAIARALARAVLFCELSTVEMVREDVSRAENS